MALTRDELQRAGATPELAALLVRESRRVDITWNPMAVGLVLAFLGVMGWLVVSQAFRQMWRFSKGIWPMCGEKSLGSRKIWPMCGKKSLGSREAS